MSSEHPFGAGVGAYLKGRELLKQKTAELAKRTITELTRCHGGSDCPAAVHHPECTRGMQ